MEISLKLKETTRLNPIVLFMRGTPDRPMCQGSMELVSALRQCQAEFAFIDVQSDPEVRAFLPKFSDSAELPQMFLNGEFFGGAEVVGELLAQGELQEMISGSGLLLRTAV